MSAKGNPFTYEICSNWELKWHMVSARNSNIRQYPSKQTLEDNNRTVAQTLDEAISRLDESYYDRHYDNHTTTTATIVPRSEQKRHKAIRKVAQKALKATHIRLNDIAKDLGEDKNTIKLWFRKKIEVAEDNQRIQDKLTKWVQKKLTYGTDFIEFMKIIDKYTKSCQKEEAKRYKIDDPQTILKNTYVLYPTPPGIVKRSLNSQILLQEDLGNLEMNSNLLPIEIELNVSSLVPKKSNSQGNRLDNEDNYSENAVQSFLDDYPASSSMTEIIAILNQQGSSDQTLHKGSQSSRVVQSSDGEFVIRDKILWDMTFADVPTIISTAYHFVRDILLEYSLTNLTQRIIQKQFAEILVQDLGLERTYIEEIARQIRDQIIDAISKKADKIGKFYPEFAKQNSTEQWNRGREKEFMKKHLTQMMNEDVPLVPATYGLQPDDAFPLFENAEMFQLLKTNLDVLPGKFTEKLITMDRLAKERKEREAAGNGISANLFNGSVALDVEKALKSLGSADRAVINNPYIPEMLKKLRHVNDMELELDQKKPIFNSSIVSTKN